jgi:hypothetical protein
MAKRTSWSPTMFPNRVIVLLKRAHRRENDCLLQAIFLVLYNAVVISSVERVLTRRSLVFVEMIRRTKQYLKKKLDVPKKKIGSGIVDEK